MTAFQICGLSEALKFTIGSSKTVWEAATYRDGSDKVIVSRIVEEGGKPFLLGLRYKTRYVDPDTKVTIVEE